MCVNSSMCWPEEMLKSSPSNEGTFSCFPRLFEVTVPPPLLIKVWLMTSGKTAAWKSQCCRKSKTSFQVFSLRFLSETHKWVSKAFTKHFDTLLAPSPTPCRHITIHSLNNYFPSTCKKVLTVPSAGSTGTTAEPLSQGFPGWLCCSSGFVITLPRPSSAQNSWVRLPSPCLNKSQQ